MLVERYLSAAWGYAVFDRSGGSRLSILLGDITYVAATAALTAAWFLSVWLWVSGDSMPGLRRSIAALGTLSLSAYLGQTLVMTFVFYGYGLGAAFHWGPAQVTLLACATFLCQLVAARWWCSRFNQGPAEWLWRCVTDWRWRPLRKVPAARY